VYRGEAQRDFGHGCTAIQLDGKPVKLLPDGRYMVGFGRDAPAAAHLACLDGPAGRDPNVRAVTVTARNWPVQSLPTLPPKPVPDAEFDARRPAELAKISAARATPSDLTGWTESFIRPAKGPQSGQFGSQRILSGQPQAPHGGLDIAAAAGSPVVAPASGVVRLAEGPFTLEGNLVMLDHGFGLVSVFMHLSRIDVRPGQTVRQGEQLGLVGATGRATGPHLHWGMTWTDVRVDPASLLKDEP
jgi:murein DD-endopeptidase MepM/ murein hydrolase activator NlpD